MTFAFWKIGLPQKSHEVNRTAGYPPFSPQMHADFLFPMQLMISDTVVAPSDWLPQNIPLCQPLPWGKRGLCRYGRFMVSTRNIHIHVKFTPLWPIWHPIFHLVMSKWCWSTKNGCLQPLNIFTGIGSTVLSLPTYSDTGIDQWADQNDGIELHLYSQDPVF